MYRRLFLTIASFFILSGFSLNSCPEGNALGENVTATYVRVDGRQEYTDTGITIEAGTKYAVSIKNSISLCSNTSLVKPSAGDDFSTDASINEWRPFPFMLGDQSIKLAVSGNYSDVNKLNTEGRGLLIYISDSPVPPPATLDLSDYSYDLNDDYTAFGGQQNGELIEFYQGSLGTSELTLFFPTDAYVFYRYANNSLYKNEESIIPDLYDPFESSLYMQTLCDECVKVVNSELNNLVCKLDPKELKLCLDSTPLPGTPPPPNPQPVVPETATGGYNITITYECNAINGEYSSIGISSNDDISQTPWTPFGPGKSVGGETVSESGEMSGFIVANQGGTVRIKLEDVFQSPADLVIQNRCSTGGGCCTQQPYPLNKVFSGSINSGPLCGDITSVPLCSQPAPGNDYPCGTIKGHGGFEDNSGFYDVYVFRIYEEKINRFFNPIIDLTHGIIFGYCSNGEPSDYSMSCINGGGGSGSKKGFMQTIYEGVTTDPFYGRFIPALLSLVIVFFSYTIMMNSIDKTFKESIYTVLRIGVVLILLQPDSWITLSKYIFSVAFAFTDYVILAMQSSVLSNFLAYFKGNVNFSNTAIATAYTANESASIFDFFYYIYAYIFTLDNFKYFITAIFINFFVGLAYALGCLILCFLLFLMVCRLLIVYLVSKFFLAFLVILSPIYIIFLLFKTTRISFLKWIKSIFNFSLQPIFAFIPIMIVSLIFFAMFYQNLLLGLSEQCLLPLFFLLTWIPELGEVLSDICILKACAPNVRLDNIINIIFTLITLGYVLMAGNNLMGWMMKVCGSITIGFGDSGLGNAFSPVDGIQKYAKDGASSMMGKVSAGIKSKK